MTKRISEAELILPSLYIAKLGGGFITTSDLIVKLRAIMKPTGEDLQILAGRKDDKFSQKVRNLIAHKTFERYGYAVRRERGIEITNDGVSHLNLNEEILKYLLINDFEYTDLTDNLKIIEANNNKRKILTFDENIIINEGNKKIAQVSVYERSSSLRNYAIQHFTIDGRISCNCCEFNFGDFYGNDIGNGFIEIHHTKPIFKYEDEDLERTLEAALGNLTPVCSNCHRMIHRNWSKPLEIQHLINNINNHGIFTRFS